MEYVASRSEYSDNLRISDDFDGHDDPAGILKRIDFLLSEVRDLSLPVCHDNALHTSDHLLADKVYSSRRAADTYFGMSGFAASPAWDIVLDLFKNEQRGKTVSISSACIGAGCPSTTALRWLQALENMSLIERSDDPNDRRRSYVALTAKGRDATIKTLQAYRVG